MPQSQHLANVEEAITGPVVDGGPDHLTVHDTVTGEDTTLRIDDQTRYAWLDRAHEGQLREGAQVRVGYNVSGQVHLAIEVIVLSPGDGAPALPTRLQPHVH